MENEDSFTFILINYLSIGNDCLTEAVLQYIDYIHLNRID